MARPSTKTTLRSQVDPAVLKRVTDAMIDIDRQKKELSSDRAVFAEEAREEGIHPKAHAFLLALLKMPGADRRLALNCFDSYRAALKLDAWQTAADTQADIEDIGKRAAA